MIPAFLRPWIEPAALKAWAFMVLGFVAFPALIVYVLPSFITAGWVPAVMGLLVTGVWALQDGRSGKISMWVMLLPIILLAFLSWRALMFFWAPGLVLCLALYVIANKKVKRGSFGIGDALALPFTLAIVSMYGIAYWALFALAFALQIFTYNNLPQLFAGRKAQGRIKLCPLLFNALLIGGAVAWIL
jgi:hypothetical protein